MRVLSLFDGISCGQVACHRAGIDVTAYYASEIDKSAKLVTHKNYPDTVHLGNVTNVNVRSLPKIDLLLGGSPCQGFSFNGKRLGLNDPRSRLFFEYVRVRKDLENYADEQGYPRPYFILENVKMREEFVDTISAYMQCYPIEIDSTLVSAQRRKRLYWTNIPVIGRPKDLGIKCQDILEHGYAIGSKAGTLTTLDHRWFMSNRSGKGSTRPGQCAYNDDHTRRYFTPIECERMQTLPDDYTKLPGDPNYYGKEWKQRYTMLGNCWTVDVITWILSFIPRGDNHG